MVTTDASLVEILRAWDTLPESARAQIASIATAPTPDRLELRTSVREIAARYQAHAHQIFRRPDGTPTRNASGVRLALRELVEQFGGADADAIGPAEIKRLRSAWASRGLTRGTINQRTGIVVRAWAWAAELGLVDDEAASRLRTIRPLKRGMAAEGKGVRPVPIDQVLATIPHMPDPVAGMVRFMLLTGCRVGEAREARSDEIDARGESWSLRPAWHKNAKHGLHREILLNAPARELVERRMHRRFLFGVGAGLKPYHRDAATMAIYRACEKAGVERWSPGRIRHTCAEQVLAEHGLEAARSILGHSTDRCTRRYSGQGEGPILRVATETLANAEVATA